MNTALWLIVLAGLLSVVYGFITVFIGFMGMVLAISPVAGQLFGAGKLRAAGLQVHQAIWLALASCWYQIWARPGWQSPFPQP